MYRLDRLLRPDDYCETFLREKRRYMAEHPLPWDEHFRSGRCTKAQVQGWAKDMYYWKLQVPIKDYGVLVGCPHIEIRRKWLPKAIEEDGALAGMIAKFTVEGDRELTSWVDPAR